MGGAVDDRARTRREFLVLSIDVTFPDEVQTRVNPSGTSEGVIYGRGLASFDASSVTVVRRRCNHGAWPCGVTTAMASSETSRVISVRVGTWFACYIQSKVRIAIWKMYAFGAGSEEATLRAKTY
jgi:hypothetical protein